MAKYRECHDPERSWYGQNPPLTCYPHIQSQLQLPLRPQMATYATPRGKEPNHLPRSTWGAPRTPSNFTGTYGRAEKRHRLRLQKFPNKLYNDAASCYDRIIPALASLLGRGQGLHRNVIFVNARTLKEAKYKLRTSTGVSAEFFFHCHAFPIYGTGQGSVNSPVIWCIISSTLFRLLELSPTDMLEPCLYQD
jgi:hypothetical protein